MPGVVGAGTTEKGTGMAIGAGDDQPLENFMTINKGLYYEKLLSLQALLLGQEGSQSLEARQTNMVCLCSFLFDQHTPFY